MSEKLHPKVKDKWGCEAFKDLETGCQIREDLKGGWLNYNFHPVYSWRAQPNFKLKTIQTNEFGLRSRSMKDLKGYRCVLLGGSFAWGYGASSNEFIPSYVIEDHLNKKYNDEVSVINMADQLYCSMQQIQSFVFSMNEINPKMVICITGYNDIAQGRAGYYQNNMRYDEYVSFFNWGRDTGLIFDGGFIKKLLRFVRRGAQRWKNPFKDNFSFSNPDPKDIPLILNNLKMDVITGIAMMKKIKVVYVLEPALFFKKNVSDYEAAYLRSDEKRCEFFREYYKQFKDKIWNDGGAYKFDNVHFIDSTVYLDEYKETLFFDWIHLSDKGFKIWSEKLAEEIHTIISA
ncbi:MAG: hypothetical protein WAX69_20155 [Victivallales bacterium]